MKDKLIGTCTEKEHEYFECPHCEDDKKIFIESEIKTFEDDDGVQYEVSDVTETCTTCGWSRQYEMDC